VVASRKRPARSPEPSQSELLQTLAAELLPHATLSRVLEPSRTHDSQQEKALIRQRRSGSTLLSNDATILTASAAGEIDPAITPPIAAPLNTQLSQKVSLQIPLSDFILFLFSRCAYPSFQIMLPGNTRS